VRTIVIGDIHGCLDEALALVRRCGATADTQVVLVGDLVAKGPSSAGVVQWARESGARAVLGNHDAHALRLRAGAPDPPERPRPDHVAVAQSLGPADWAWLGALPLWLWLEPADAGAGAPRTHLVVHAGLVPGVPLEEQQRDNLLNLRSITPAGAPSKKIDGAPWASLWRGPPHVIFGHDAVRGLQRHDWATGLDTGCVYGRELTALVLPEGKLVSEPARRAYAPMKK
jgi:Calcineurin-like phosphoesterase